METKNIHLVWQKCTNDDSTSGESGGCGIEKGELRFEGSEVVVILPLATIASGKISRFRAHILKQACCKAHFCVTFWQIFTKKKRLLRNA
jgi:hypothetical protein